MVGFNVGVIALAGVPAVWGPWRRYAMPKLSPPGGCSSYRPLDFLFHDPSFHKTSIDSNASHTPTTTNMSDNVGLPTPRGSGTSGYIQRNLAHMKPRNNMAPYPPRDAERPQHRLRQPDKGLLEHERKREVEVKVFELRDKLEEEGYVLPVVSPIQIHRL